jgi:hypothetical protein
MTKDFFTEDEAATILCMTPLMLARRRRAGKISAVKDGHVIGYTSAHLAEYQKNHQRRSLVSAEDIDPNTLIMALKRQLLKK